MAKHDEEKSPEEKKVEMNFQLGLGKVDSGGDCSMGVVNSTCVWVTYG